MADAAKAERQRIAALPLVVESLKVPAARATAAAATSGSTAVPGDTAKGPWLDLKKLKWTRAEGNQFFESGLKWDEPITFDGKEYKPRSFIYTHAGGKLIYEFKVPVTGFKAKACLEERSWQGGAVFIITTDEGEVFRTKTINPDHRSEDILIDFKPTRKLVIDVDMDGPNSQDWHFLLEPEYR